MRPLLPLLVLAACGRSGFDHVDAGAATPDVLVVAGHDEDGDGRVDAVDVCPHLTDDGADGDSDGVGDACDPHPTTPGDSITVFSPLTPGTYVFDAGTPYTQEADGILLTGDNTLFRTGTLGTTRVEFGFEIVALGANPQHQVATGFEGTNPFYFVELNDNGPVKNAGIVQYDGTNGYIGLTSMAVPMVHTGRGVQLIDATAGATPTFHLVTGWPGELYEMSASTPAYTTSTGLRITLNGVDIRIEYLVVIESP